MHADGEAALSIAFTRQERHLSASTAEQELQVESHCTQFEASGTGTLPLLHWQALGELEASSALSLQLTQSANVLPAHIRQVLWQIEQLVEVGLGKKPVSHVHEPREEVRIAGEWQAEHAVETPLLH